MMQELACEACSTLISYTIQEMPEAPPESSPESSSESIPIEFSKPQDLKGSPPDAAPETDDEGSLEPPSAPLKADVEKGDIPGMPAILSSHRNGGLKKRVSLLACGHSKKNVLQQGPEIFPLTI